MHHLEAENIKLRKELDKVKYDNVLEESLGISQELNIERFVRVFLNQDLNFSFRILTGVDKVKFLKPLSSSNETRASDETTHNCKGLPKEHFGKVSKFQKSDPN